MENIKIFKRVFLSLFIVIAVAASSAFAITDKEMGIIINLAGKQRMLTQKMSKDALLIAEGIDVEKNKKDLKKSMQLFEKTLKGLMRGDKSLRLAKTDNKEILAQLKKVNSLWSDFKKDLNQVLKGNTSKKVLENIARKNIPLLKNMHKAVTMFVAKSGSLSKLDKFTANAINIAGRQRMLTQKIAKDLLLIDLGIDPKKNKQNLKESVELFDSSLNGLLNGSKKLGLKPCQLNHIKKQLLIVKGYWDQIKPTLNEDKYSKARLKAIVNALDLTLVEMDKAVKMYEKSIKRQIKISEINSLVQSYEKVLAQSDNMINQAYRQQARTQEMVKEIILMIMGVDPKTHLSNLKKSSEEFDKTLNAFLNGDERLGIAKVTDQKSLKKLKEVKKEWDPFYENIKKFLSGKIDREALLYILNNNEKLLSKSNGFTEAIKRAKGAHSLIGAYQSSKVSLVERERYLLQKMMKEKLLIEGNIDPEKNQKKLKGSMLIFQNILSGNKKFGSLNLDHPKSAKQLEKVKNIWNSMRDKFMKKCSNRDLLFLIENSPVLDKNLAILAKLIKEDTSD
ncbi:MAG: hypothetical protein GXO31_05480 [Epsilonproteobacteria bacterium]|nr:hypothetical protein [Campylobacterota bacterium]